MSIVNTILHRDTQLPHAAPLRTFHPILEFTGGIPALTLACIMVTNGAEDRGVYR